MSNHRTTRLARYLDAASGGPCTWRSACWLIFIGEWVRQERPRSPWWWVEACQDEAGAQAMLKAQGGPCALMRIEAERAGLVAADPARAGVGAIGLVALPVAGEGRTETVGCIRTPSRKWAIRTRSGLFLLAARKSLRPHLAWKV